jgi:superfamily II DNA/RNA helicase
MSRGVVIDVHCLLVINYDIPTNIENYAHRVARNKVTSVINFVTAKEVSQIKSIEKYYNTTIGEFLGNFN